MADDTCEELERLIGELVDGTHDPVTRARVDRHLSWCPVCRELAVDLTRIHEAARALPAMEPPESVWVGVAAELDAGSRAAVKPRSPLPLDWTIAWEPWRLALAAGLLAAIGVSGALAVRGLSPRPTPAVSGGYLTILEQVETDLVEAERHYTAALEGLAALAGSNEPVAQQAETLRQHLMLLDQMIEESRMALQTDPVSGPAQRSLFDGVRRKFGLVQDAIALLDGTPRPTTPGGSGPADDVNRRM